MVLPDNLVHKPDPNAWAFRLAARLRTAPEIKVYGLRRRNEEK